MLSTLDGKDARRVVGLMAEQRGRGGIAAMMVSLNPAMAYAASVLKNELVWETRVQG